MDHSDFFKEILIVMVLYKKSIKQSSAFKTIEELIALHQSSITIFVYDNSPTPDFTSCANIIYRHAPENNGVSKAYNEACLVALTLHKKWMLLLDQDTEIRLPVFNMYQLAVFNNSNLPLFAPLMKDAAGIISPFHFRHGKGYRFKKMAPGIHSLYNARIINSCMLISVDAFCNTQGFDERFPLDLSDVVFLDRFRIRYPHFVLIDAVCKHGLSAHDNNTMAALSRFKVFSQAMHQYKDIQDDKIWLGFILLVRSIKLFFRHRRFEFLKIAMTRTQK